MQRSCEKVIISFSRNLPIWFQHDVIFGNEAFFAI